MVQDTHTSPFVWIIFMIFSIFLFILARGNTLAIMEFEKRVSEETLVAGLYYTTQALPCLSRNANALDETKRFVLDRAVLDSEIGGLGRLSCASYDFVKYWIGVYDLDRPGGQWTFKNFQPPEEGKFRPRYGQIVLIDDGGVMHRAFIAIEIDAEPSKGQPDWMFCNTTLSAAKEPSDFAYTFNDWPSENNGRGIEDIYYYKTNGCESGNCIKGAGQALPTCQPQVCKYSKEAGDSCDIGCECKSSSCTAGICDDKKQRALVAGQPCKIVNGNNGECDKGLVCAKDMRCKKDAFGGIDLSKLKYG